MCKTILTLLAAIIFSISLIGCGTSNDVPEPTIPLPDKSANVSVFYATGNTLVEEKHIVADDRNVVQTTLNELLAAKPQTYTDIAIVQPECKVINVKIDKKGLATIDFDKRVLTFDAPPKEKRLAYAAIAQTLKQFKNIKAMKFLVEGKDKGTVLGKDVQKFWGDLSLKYQPWQLQ
jgi:spore germination protein GerM